MGKPPRPLAARNTTPPKLRFDSLPFRPSPSQLGIATPPLQPQASVPFLWEEAPGKPKITTIRRRSLLFSPLLPAPPAAGNDHANGAETELPAPPSSPTAVLDGPYHHLLLLPDGASAYLDGPSAVRIAASRSSVSMERSASWSFDDQRRPGDAAGGVKRRKRLVWLFWRTRDRHGRDGTREGRKLVRVVTPEVGSASSGFVPGRHSSCEGEVAGRLGYYIGEEEVVVVDGDEGEDDGGGGSAGDDTCAGAEGTATGTVEGLGGGETNVRLTRWTKGRSRTNKLFAGATAHLWESIFGGLKHAAVPWRRSRVPEEPTMGTGGKSTNRANSPGSRITLQMFLI